MNALLANETENILQDAAGVLEQDQEQKFRITNLEQATWAMRKLRALSAKEDDIKKVAQAELSRIQGWMEAEIRDIDSSRQFFIGILEAYHRGLFQNDPKVKTIKTPYGRLKLTKQQLELQRNETAIKDWAKDNKPDVLIPQEPKLDWSGLKKQLKINDDKAIDPATGEVIPGITVINREPKFTVEVDV
ncbi:host-nuclease inhibitor Gam family protein [Desulfotomaculum sp. 1211_IL3151]|uniref:host-nuclease inhibitor Gam family protein n=1 Tax=Desulfotomaculum sp. 1211_IL3151 TaxID=3084055 RepID=UPI002FDAB3A2